MYIYIYIYIYIYLYVYVCVPEMFPLYLIDQDLIPHALGRPACAPGSA
jgi:hypothetical protein